MTTPATGVYELWGFFIQPVYPLGLDNPFGDGDLLVELPSGTSPAPQWTATNVGTNQMTFQINGSYVAPDQGTWIKPSSTAYVWRVEKQEVSPPGGGPSVDNSFVVWLPDKSAGWGPLVVGNRRRDGPVYGRSNPAETTMYLSPGYAVPFYFKRVA